MTGPQLGTLALTLVLLSVVLWIVLVSIPMLLDALVLRRLRSSHDELASWMSSKKHLRNNPEVREVERFLRANCQAKPFFGLAEAAAVLVVLQLHPGIGEPVATGAPGPSRLTEAQSRMVETIMMSTTRWVFYRAFLASNLWFVTWPGALWARYRFSNKRLNDAGEDASSSDLIWAPFEALLQSGSIAGGTHDHRPVAS